MSKGIVTLCGSVRFRSEFERANRELTLAGFIVLAPGVFEHDWLHKPENNAELTKDGLDKLHCEKIAMSDYVAVINKGQYCGKSTKGEILYAQFIGFDSETDYPEKKGIFWLEPSTHDDTERSITELIAQSARFDEKMKE
jgi:hypothetical protein